MADWDLYEKKLKIYGETSREAIVNETIDSINSNFEYNPSYKLVWFNNSTTPIGVQIIDGSSSDTSRIDSSKKIIMKPDDVLKIGDSISDGKVTWICTSVELVNGMYYIGAIQECNNILKFYKNNIKHEIYCIYKSKILNRDDNKYISLPSGTYMVTIPSGTIDKSDFNKRYLLNGSAYRTINIDDSENGIIHILIEDDEKNNNTDDFINGIADGLNYNFSVQITNGSTADVLVTKTLQLNTVVKLNNVQISSPKITYTSSNLTVATVNSSGLVTSIGVGTSNITATYNGISSTIAINIVGSLTDKLTVLMSPNISEILTGSKATITAKILNNGIEDTNKYCSFSLRNKDGSSNVYATFASNDFRTCIVNAKSIVNKTIILRAEYLYDSSVYKEIEIDIVSMI